MSEPDLRPATPADGPRLAEVMAESLETYRAFAGPGFSPPTADEIAAEITPRLGRPSVWCELAEADGGVAGYVSMVPATEARLPSDDPRLMHFWMLFVRAPWWGTGLAARLHGDACAEATARGFTAMRLFTPALQARARRFYEREGWHLASGPHPHHAMQIEMVEYRRPLTA